MCVYTYTLLERRQRLEAWPHSATQSSLRLTLQPRLSLNFHCSSCFNSPSVGNITTRNSSISELHFFLKLNQQQCTLKIILKEDVTTYLSSFESQVNSHLGLCDLGSRREKIIMHHQKRGSILEKKKYLLQTMLL